MAADRRAEIATLLQDRYEGFGPTLATEKLAAVEGIAVSVETLRQMRIGLGLWRPKTWRARRVFQVRERQLRFGELIQIDGGPHAWFEGRRPCCTLIVFIDDTMERLTALLFAPAESTRADLEALRDHVLAHGPPLAFSDRHGIFRVDAKDAAGGDGRTEPGRVAARLDITSIHPPTPQAEGRVERADQTLQDRLVKELRLTGICPSTPPMPCCCSSRPPGTRSSPSDRATVPTLLAPGTTHRTRSTTRWRGETQENTAESPDVQGRRVRSIV